MRGICRLDVAGSRRRGRWLVRDVDLVLHDDGIDEHEDTEWDDQSEYLCTQCEFAGKVKDCQIKNEHPKRRYR